MKDIPSKLLSHMSSSLTTLAILWKITRKDGVIKSFTNHVVDITFEGTTYEAKGGVSSSAITQKIDLAVDNSDFSGFFIDFDLPEEDILAGKYDDADIEVRLVNYLDLSYGSFLLQKGNIGNFKTYKLSYTAEIRGLTQKLQQNFMESYQKSCRASLGDGRCKFNLSGLATVSGSSYPASNTGLVSSVGTDKLIFTDLSRLEPKGFFTYGTVTFTSGENEGFTREIKYYFEKQFILYYPLPFSIAVGDTYDVVAGCDKLFTTCSAKFNNAINFRGEPHLPGKDKLFETSSNKSDVRFT